MTKRKYTNEQLTSAISRAKDVTQLKTLLGVRALVRPTILKQCKRLGVSCTHVVGLSGNDYTCAECGCSFTTETQRPNSGKAFCSHTCSAKHSNTHRITRNKNPENKACLRCGEILKTNSLTYCSVGCGSAHRSETRVEGWLGGNVWNGNGCVPPWAKAYVLSDQNNKCAICGCGDKWQGKPLVFVADHVDGDAWNNKRENIRCVCPNCDSQLDTYKAKNIGKGRSYRRK